MRITDVFIVLLFSIFISCSTHIYTRNEVIKVIKNGNYKKLKLQRVIVSENDSTIHILIKDTIHNQFANEMYRFDKDGNQLSYIVTASCDTCFQIPLKNALNNKWFKWERINDSLYHSRNNSGRVLKINPSKYSFELVKEN